MTPVRMETRVCLVGSSWWKSEWVTDWLTVNKKREISSGVGLEHIVDPVEELAHLDIDPRVTRLCTSLTPRHQAVHLSKAHQRAAWVTLTNRGRSSCDLASGVSSKTLQQQKAATLPKKMGTKWLRLIYIAGVSASIHVSSAHHPAWDHVRIGPLTGGIVHHRDIQALQAGGHGLWMEREHPKDKSQQQQVFKKLPRRWMWLFDTL